MDDVAIKALSIHFDLNKLISLKVALKKKKKKNLHQANNA